MIIRIHTEGPGAEEELRSLRLWLTETPEIRQNSKISWGLTAPGHGQMDGGLVDVLQLITDNTWQLSTFALAYASWRNSRRDLPRVVIERGEHRIALEGHDEESIQRIIQFLTPDEQEEQ